MFKKSLATAALAVIAVFAFAPAANAVDYVSDSHVTVSASAVQGEIAQIDFADSAFVPAESIRFTVTGSTGVQLAVVKAAVDTSLTKNATSTGSSSLSVTIPDDATGSFSVTASAASATYTATLTVVAADAGAPVAVDNGLATTGYNAPVLVIWGAAGVLVLGVALLLVRISVRRQHAAA